jgi:hypothetical protein
MSDRKRLPDLDAKPEKRSYWAIVHDYSFTTAICELIDNPLDVWIKGGKGSELTIQISLDLSRQKIEIDDDSGGVPFDQLALLVRPGASSGLETDQAIGIFGVGSKRSVVALAEDIIITTCSGEGPAYSVEYGHEWVALPTWDVPCYELSAVNPRHTTVHLRKLRHSITTNTQKELIPYISETYGRFLSGRNLTIKVNGDRVSPVLFNNWSYPREYSPLQVEGKIETPDGDVDFSILGGLLDEAEYSSGEYGVYIYCNDRLISKAVKSPEVGFATGHAGVPHHSHSACRVILSLNGPSKWMPWNSSKSGINYTHETFKRVQSPLVDIVTTYFTLSKRLQPQWNDEIFPCKSGIVTKYTLENNEKVTAAPLPTIPKARPSYAAEIGSANRDIVSENPWRKKFVDAITLMHGLQRQKGESRNDLTVLLMDRMLDLAFKDYLLREKSFSFNEVSKLLASREEAIKTVMLTSETQPDFWVEIQNLTTKAHSLLFESESPITSEREIETFRLALQRLFRKLFGIRFPSRDDTTFS